MSGSNYWSKALNQHIARRRALAMSGAATISAALLAACGSSGGEETQDSSGLVSKPADTSKQAKRGGTLKWFWKAEPPNFDPSFGSTNNRTPKNMTNSLLVQYKPGYLGPAGNEVIPDLAESWEVSPDKTELTFRIRQGVKWHNLPPLNGRAFDVEDILFSWERLLKVNSQRSRIANSINPEAPVLSVKAPDSKTVVFKLKEPVSYIMQVLANQVSGWMVIVPKETDSTLDLRSRFLGTGPFMLTKAEPSVTLEFKRNPDYFHKDRPYVDAVEMPIVPEYATQLAQFRTGGIYTIPVRKEDVLSQKHDIPDLNLIATDVAPNGGKMAFGWLPTDKSPFLDKRVRQAMSMSWDRDLFLEAVNNITEFESQGLPITTRWNTALSTNFEGYWLDPKSKEFGPNAKYYQHDIKEAKALLSAAGYPNGLDADLTFTPSIGEANQREILVQFAAEAGIRLNQKSVDVTTVYTPMRDSFGQFEGILQKNAPAPLDAIALFATDYSLKGGVTFYGFNADGKSAPTGDPKVEDFISRGMAEFDTEKRQAIAHEVQRYLAEKMYLVFNPGGASGFDLAWPALQNFGVYSGESDQIPTYWWIDETKPPFKKA